MGKFTLRWRLLLGHILPILILVPLVGLALIYLLETRLILPLLANEMIDQGMLVERLTRDQPAVWASQPDAQALLDSIDFHRPTRIGLLTPGYVLLATNRPDDRFLVGKAVSNLPALNDLANPWWAVTSNGASTEQILDVLIPVAGSNGQVLGLIRIYRRITDVEQTFTMMRLLVLGVLMVGLIIAAVIAIFLSESVSRPLKSVTQAFTHSPLEGPASLLREDENEFGDLARAYNRLQRRRQELEETRQELLAGLVHEIGRPLGSLRTAVHALQAGAMDNPDLRSDLLKGMVERIDRMGHLLEDLSFAYHKLEPREIHHRPVKMKEWLDSLIALWAETARQKQQIWVAMLPDDLPVLNTDPDHLAQGLSNLVNNAFKFTPAGGKITFEVFSEDKTIRFRISDNGIGIPLEDQPHLFSPFYRSIQPPWKAPGLGLGLSITKSIVESLDGQIELTSAPGQGSTFTISLPIE